MASVQQLFTFGFLVAVISGHEILQVEGRQLNHRNTKTTSNSQHQTSSVETKRNIFPPANPNALGSSAATRTTDFRPTTPGNSPGIGHSFAVLKANLKHARNAPAAAYSVDGSTDNFRPTPGHSPGVGHSFGSFRANLQKSKSQGKEPSVTYSAAGSTDTFRPTTPGHSPGVGHSFNKLNAGPN